MPFTGHNIVVHCTVLYCDCSSVLCLLSRVIILELITWGLTLRKNDVLPVPLSILHIIQKYIYCSCTRGIRKKISTPNFFFSPGQGGIVKPSKTQTLKTKCHFSYFITQELSPSLVCFLFWLGKECRSFFSFYRVLSTVLWYLHLVPGAIRRGGTFSPSFFFLFCLTHEAQLEN